MFGLGLPQLVLILAGSCFLVAGLYGLAPSVVTARFGSNAASSLTKEPRLSRKQARAKAREEALKLVQLRPQPQISKEMPPAMKAQANVVPLTPAVETRPALAAAGPLPVEPEQAPVANVGAATVEAATPAPAQIERSPGAEIETASSAAPVNPEPAEPESVVMDQELVEELFSEMFALRSTMAGLVDEVKQLRTEQRSRRFIVEEVPA